MPANIQTNPNDDVVPPLSVVVMQLEFDGTQNAAAAFSITRKQTAT